MSKLEGKKEFGEVGREEGIKGEKDKKQKLMEGRRR